MKTTIRLFFVSVLLLSVTGCYINKRGYLCGITLGEYMCDPVLDAWLSRGLLPIDTYWPLSNQTKETRKEDWVECGGFPDGMLAIEPLADGQTRTREQSDREWARLWDKVDLCMQNKGYQYFPICFTLDEKCGPPPPAPNGGSWPAWLLRQSWPEKSLCLRMR